MTTDTKALATELDRQCELLEAMYAKVFDSQADALQARFEAYQSGLVKCTWQRHVLDVVGAGRRWRIVVDHKG